MSKKPNIIKPIFTYKGKVEELARQVSQHKKLINETYYEVLGNERYSKLEHIVGNIFKPDMFFDSIEDFNTRFNDQLPSNMSSKFMMATDASCQLNEDGTIKDKKARIGTLFYISEQSFKYSNSSQFTEKIIASYIHEYDHLVFTALQKVPIYLAQLYLTNGKGPIKQLDELLKLATRITLSDQSKKDKENQIYLALFSYILDDVYEKANHILDKVILEKIGIIKELPWRNQPRYQVIDTRLKDFGVVIRIPCDGDPFMGLSDEDAINHFIAWEKTQQLINNSSYINNLFDSFKKLKVELVPFLELYSNSCE